MLTLVYDPLGDATTPCPQSHDYPTLPLWNSTE